MSSKPTKVENSKPSKVGQGLGSFFAATVILLSLIVSTIIYVYIMGDPNNFEGGDPINGHPLPGNTLGIIYKGGFIVPILVAINLIVIAFSIERYITISKAKGKGKLNVFVRKLQGLIAEGNLESAEKECDKQEGSLANVLKAGLTRYRLLENDTTLDKEHKVITMQQELEEATALELPMLSKNLAIVSTMASISTLVGLIGTVLGMIKAFAALAQAGAPDAVALANGISEALINTALGITGSTIAIIAYNYFTSQIDGLTYKMDEAGFSLIATFKSKVQ